MSVGDRHKAIENFVMAYVQTETPPTCVMDYRRTIMAAAREYGLAVHDRAVVLALGNDQMCSESEPCGSCARLREERARLSAIGESATAAEAMGSGKGE